MKTGSVTISRKIQGDNYSGIAKQRLDKKSYKQQNTPANSKG
jgi:hypothetical protein